MVGVSRVSIISYLCMAISKICAALPIMAVCYRVPIANAFGAVPPPVIGIIMLDYWQLPAAEHPVWIQVPPRALFCLKGAEYFPVLNG